MSHFDLNLKLCAELGGYTDVNSIQAMEHAQVYHVALTTKLRKEVGYSFIKELFLRNT